MIPHRIDQQLRKLSLCLVLAQMTPRALRTPRIPHLFQPDFFLPFAQRGSRSGGLVLF